jgi:bifunctional DNA primase/polymerase-like protein
MTDRIFAEHAQAYTEAGYWPRPIKNGTKGSHLRNWQKPDPDRAEKTILSWQKTYPDAGIGLLLGSPFLDGTLLGALDIDHDDYVRVASVLLGGNPPCGRFGSKGIAYFVRVAGDGKYRQFKFKPEGSSKFVAVAELLCTKRLCVIPPTIHPKTERPYHWIGKPLLETPYTELPIIEV